MTLGYQLQEHCHLENKMYETAISSDLPGFWIFLGYSTVSTLRHVDY